MRSLGHARDLLPELLGLVVLAENGDVEAVFGQAVVLGDQVPGELDGIGLEVIAEREIAQHFEEGVVAAGVADVFQIVVLAARAHAFLRGGGARVVALLEAQEDVLELVHAGVGEQQGGIVRGDQRRTAHDAVAAGGEEVEKALSDFVTCHGDSFWNGLKSNCRSWRLKTGGVDGQGSSAIMDLCIGPSKSSRKLRRRSGTQPMSFLDNLENNLKALENQEEKNPEKVKRDRERREAERASALLRAPHAEALKNSAFTSQLLTQCRTIGREQRVLVQFTWIGENLRLDAAAKRWN